MVTTTISSIGSLSKAVSGATNASPIVLTVPSGHGIGVLERVKVSGVGGTTAANGSWVVSAVSATTITLQGTTGNGAYTSGGTVERDYATVQLWEAATDINLVGSDVLHVGEMYQDAASDYTIAAGSAAITLDGATSDATRYRILRAGANHRWDPTTRSGVCIRKTQGNPLGMGLVVNEDYARVEGIGVEILDGSVTSGTYYAVQVQSSNNRLDSVWARYAVGSGSQIAACFGHTAGTNLRATNCIASGSGNEDEGAAFGFTSARTGDAFYNCAAYGCRMKGSTPNSSKGFNVTGTSAIVQNCIAIENANSQGGSVEFATNLFWALFSYNISSDSSSNQNGGVGSWQNQSAYQTWVYAQADDFRNKATSRAIDSGITLASEVPADFNGTTRTNFWEIGPYDGNAVVVSSAPTVNVSSIGAGAGRDYATIELWRAATARHLISENVVEIGELYDDADFSLGGTTQTIDGATCDSTRYRELRAASGSRYDPRSDVGVWITGTAATTLKVTEDHFRLTGVGVANTSSGGSRVAVEFRGRYNMADGVLARVTASSGSADAACFYGASKAGHVWRNCIAVGAGSGSAGANYGFRSTGEDARVSNCVAYNIDGAGGTSYGFHVSKASARVVNCAGVDCDTDFETSVSSTCDYNASTDSTAPGANSITAIVVADSFQSISTGDFRLKAGSALLNVGLSLSTEFSTDFSGSTRKAPWEIGAFDGFAFAPLLASIRFGRCLHAARLWYIERTDGVALAFTDADRSIDHGGVTYLPGGGLDQSARRATAALRESNAEFRGAIQSDVISFDDLFAKRYDAAKVTESIIDMRRPWKAPVSVQVYYIEAVSFTGEEWVAEVASQTQRLFHEVGDTLARDCPAQLGDARCRFDVAPLSDYGQTVDGVSLARSTFEASALAGAHDDDHFVFGRVVWLTGDNAGVVSEVLRYDDSTGEFELQEPTPFDIQSGDTFDAIVGCNGLAATCRDKFGNYLNFRGSPFTPSADRMIQSPQR